MTRRSVALLMFVFACSDDSVSKPVARGTEHDEKATLARGVVARVGGEPIQAELVAAVAAEQHIAADEALHRLIDDAVAAQAARMRRLDRVPPTRWKLTAALGRLTADRLREHAVAKGPPTEDEVKELTRFHWQQVDRDVSVKVVHAVVLAPKDPALNEAGKEEAKKLRTALLDTTTKDEFLEKAKAWTPPAGLQIHAEELPPFIEEGGWVTVGPDATFDQTFARGAHAIAKPGDTSAVVETKHGFHVIRLLERIPAQKLSYEARRSAFTEEAHANRARGELNALLAELRARHPVAISTAAETLMRSAHNEPDQPPAPKQ